MFEDTYRKTQGKHVVSSRRVPLPDKNVARNMTLNVTNAARLAAVRCFNVELDANASDFGGKGGSVVHYSSRNSNLLLDTPATPKRGEFVIYSSSPR